MDEDNRKALMEEVVKGREFAEQLQQVIVNNPPTNELLSQHLVNNLLNSFTNTLFLLDIKKLQPTPIPTNQSQMNNLSLITTSSISSDQESSSRTSSSPADQSNKRRKTTQTSSSWENMSETPTEDGHQWRKYGQKTILNSKYARNYYRCSHKLEQKCQATKQVQRIQEKPPLYKTTYYGHHICNCNNPDIILDDPTSSHDNTSILLSFDKPTKQQYCPFLSSEEDQLSSSSYQTHLIDQSSSMLESDVNDTDMIYGLLCDSFELDHFFQTFVGFS